MCKVIKLILVIGWMGLIFAFSNDTGIQSTKKSDGFIIRLVESVLRKDLSEIEKEKWVNYLVRPVRKGAHFGVYLILGILVFSLVREFFSGYKTILLAIGISFLYSCSDEIHQLLIPGRSGQISDIVLDTIGASIGVILFSLIVKKKNKIIL